MANKNPLIAKKNIILRWRKQKDLCPSCGKDRHSELCVEDYSCVDMRDNKQKNDIPLPTEQKEEKQHTVVPVVVPVVKIPQISFKSPKLDQKNKTKYNRNFLLVDPRGIKFERLDYTDIRYLAKKYQNFIIMVIGIEYIYPYAQVLELHKIANIRELKLSTNEQDIIDHLWDCVYFVSYQSKYTEYAKAHNIPHVVIEKNNAKTKLPKLPNERDMIYVKHNQAN